VENVRYGTPKVDVVNQKKNAPDEVFEAIHTIMHLFRSEQYRALRDGPYDLTHMEGKILAFLARNSGATLSELVAYLRRDKSQLARLIKSLREQGLLLGQNDKEDRRTVRRIDVEHRDAAFMNENNSDPFGPLNLAISPEQIARAQARNGWKLSVRTFKTKFAKFPIEVLEKLISEHADYVELALLTQLYDRHFSDYGNNPVKLTSCALLEKYKIGRWQKYRGMKNRINWGLISVVQHNGKNPLVTLNWLPIQK
jgi:DNA-binding MarR family transcriptional regulator